MSEQIDTTISLAENDLLQAIRDLGHGFLTVEVHAKQPVKVLQPLKSHLLGKNGSTGITIAVEPV